MKSKIRLEAKIYNKRMTQDQLSKMHALLDAGALNYFQISEACGCSEATVNNHAYIRRKQQREQAAREAQHV